MESIAGSTSKDSFPAAEAHDLNLKARKQSSLAFFSLESHHSFTSITFGETHGNLNPSWTLARLPPASLPLAVFSTSIGSWELRYLVAETREAEHPAGQLFQTAQTRFEKCQPSVGRGDYI